MTGTVLPGYQILERLSKGRQTVVYRALREEDSRAVVLKTLRTTYPSLKHLSRLKREYEILLSFGQGPLVKAFDLRNIGDQLVLVLEDIGGSPLSNYLKQQEIDLLSKLELCIGVTRQLAEIHRREVIHKDINPDNIVVHPITADLRIIDFSIAVRFSEASQKKSGIHSLTGTLAYISPEQTGRMNRGVDYRSDFYSLGTCLYEILCGHPPFDTNDPAELVHCHLARNPPALCDRNPELPEVLARIVDRLMAKNPEERYQSADGIAADLELCREGIASMGSVEPFPIATRDCHGVFRIPQELYGRTKEMKTLEHIFKGVCQGHREMLLVSGHSGVGKSALIHEIHKSVTEHHGFLIIGKFDQFQRNTPFAPLIQAFSELVHLLLAQSSQSLAHWRKCITEALGTNCSVLLDVVPDLALIIGKQPGTTTMSGAESDGRFLMVLKEFIGVLSAADHPLLIFLDDLQWADSATLRLCESLLADATIRGLFLIGAYRDKEINEKHPLHRSLKRLNGRQFKVHAIHLNRLKKEHVLEMVADTLRGTAVDTGPLADLVYDKTLGNPFFINEFLRSLYKEEIIFYREKSGRWAWDHVGASKMGVTEDVLAFLTTRLRKLPKESQHVLTLAACIGNPFALSDLSVVAQLPPTRVSEALERVIQEGIVFPLEEGGQEENQSLDVPGAYEFLHDRVQQAAVQLLRMEQRGKTHLEVGRLMLANASEEKLGRQLFDITNQFNLGLAWLQDRSERLRVARLNLLAGIRARLSTAYEPALDFLSSGLALLPENCWQTCHGLAMALYRERAECEYLCNNFQTAENLFSTAIENARTVMEKAAIFNLRIELYVHMGKYIEAIEVGIEGLGLFGIELPLEHDQLEGVSLSMLATIQDETKNLSIDDLLHIPKLEDEVIHMVMKMMINLWNPAVNVNLKLMELLSLYMVRLSLEHGNDELSSFGFTCYGMVLGSQYGDYNTARKFGELGLQLSHKFDNLRLQCRVSFFHGANVLPWSRPMRESQGLLNDAYHTGLACGDFMWASISLSHMIHHHLLMGDPLDVVFRETEAHIGFMTKVRYQQALEVVNLIRKGIKKSQGSLADLRNNRSDTEFLMRNQKRLFLVVVFHYYYWQAQMAYLVDDFEQAEHQSLTAEKYLPYVFGWLTVVDHYFYSALIAIALIKHRPQEEHAALFDRAGDCRNKLAEWAQANPADFQPRLLLVEAELSGLRDSFETAVDYYDAAFEGAKSQENLSLAALASALAGRFFLQKKKHRIAAVYLGEACVYYQQHGSHALLEKIRDEFPNATKGVDDYQGKSHTTTEDSGGFIDMSTLMKASLTISSEIHLDRLLEKMLRLVMENAGAQKGILFLEKDGHLYEEAEGHVDQEKITLPGSRPLGEGENVSHGVVHYVFNTAEPLILANAARRGEFTNDIYITINEVKSILCQPVLFRGKVNGILYLENNLIAGAFTTYHLEVLKLLTSEAAIAIENARLYANLAKTSDQLLETNTELERTNLDLELMVNNRTFELQEKNTELERTLERNHEMQQRIIHQEKMASLGTLTAGIAHEIRNPLNFVNNFAEVSNELMAELDEHLKAHGHRIDPGPRGLVDETLADLSENLRRINDHGKRADRIVRAMLLHSHGNPSAKPEPTDINQLVDEYVNLAYHSARVRDARFGLKVHSSYDPNVGLIDAVPQDLCRVFLNIVDNACYAMLNRLQEKGYSPSLVVETRDADTQVEVAIRDNGGGIPSEIEDKIFTPFFTTKPSGGGTGLGLSISYDIVVKQHQGQLTVFSHDDTTEFRVTLLKKLYKPLGATQ